MSNTSYIYDKYQLFITHLINKHQVFITMIIVTSLQKCEKKLKCGNPNTVNMI